MGIISNPKIGEMMIRILFILILISQTSVAETIKFSEDELAPESVLPIFPRSVYVKNRNIVKTNSLEIQPVAGISMNNPFFDAFTLGGSLGFYFSEEHGINLMVSKMFDKKSKYAVALEQYQEGGTVKPQQKFDVFQRHDMVALFNYEYSPFYGKLSLAKWINLNTDIVATLGAGYVFLKDAEFPAISIGLGQRFYLGKSFGFRFNIYSFFYKGVDYLARKYIEQTGKLDSNTIDKELKLDIISTMGLIVLL